jgi:hypothetical protein
VPPEEATAAELMRRVATLGDFELPAPSAPAAAKLAHT